MTALDLLSLVNQVLFVGLFVVVLRNAVRTQTRAAYDTALLFGAVAAVVAITQLAELAGVSDDRILTPIILLLLNLAPYAMIRLVGDFSGTPRWVQVGGAVAYLAIAAVGFAFPFEPRLVEIATIVWFLAVGGYAAVAFAREVGRTRGITRRRMRAVAVGAMLFIGAIVVVFLGVLAADGNTVLGAVGQLGALGAVISFFLGFAPPAWIRRAWREPDLRLFLERSLHLIGVGDERQVIVQLQQSAATAFGATGASIGISDGTRPLLRYASTAGGWVEYPDDEFIAGWAFRDQRRVVALDAPRADPEHAEAYERAGAETIIAAPITTEERRMGALAVYAGRAPIFIDEDLWLIELLADQTGVLLEARDLARQAGELQAREEAARLKEEFLSAAAHDLRTPLTVVLGQAELLERRLIRDPAAQVDRAGVSRIASEARRLRDLISELLDAQRLEQPGVPMDRVALDLRELVTEVRRRQLDLGLAIEVTQPSTPVLGTVDRMRVEQVLDNLIENAIKYSLNRVPPEIRLWAEADEARIDVLDRGVGIPAAERDRIFERFYRASNAQGITDTGMGLGLYICRRIVEEHGGRIWVDETPGGGSTFCVALPLEPPADEPSPSEVEPAWTSTGDLAGAQPAEAAADA
jgi:signal transduction histidine kinase